MHVYSYIDPLLGIVQTDRDDVQDVLTENGTIVNQGRRGLESAHHGYWLLTGPDHPEGLYTEAEAAHWVATGELPPIVREPAAPEVKADVEVQRVGRQKEDTPLRRKDATPGREYRRVTFHLSPETDMAMRIYATKNRFNISNVAEKALVAYLQANAINENGG